MSLSIFVSLLFSLLWITNAATDISSSDLITKTCSETTNIPLCYKILKPSGVPAGKTLSDLARVALTPTKLNAQNTYQLTSFLLKNEKSQNIKQIYASCLEDYSEAVDNLNKWENYLKLGKYNYLPVTAVLVSTKPVSCDLNFVGGKNEPAQLKVSSQNLQDLCSIVSVISNLLNENN